MAVSAAAATANAAQLWHGPWSCAGATRGITVFAALLYDSGDVASTNCAYASISSAAAAAHRLALFALLHAALACCL
jgi:hypothetical protein